MLICSGTNRQTLWGSSRHTVNHLYSKRLFSKAILIPNSHPLLFTQSFSVSFGHVFLFTSHFLLTLTATKVHLLLSILYISVLFMKNAIVQSKTFKWRTTNKTQLRVDCKYYLKAAQGCNNFPSCHHFRGNRDNPGSSLFSLLIHSKTTLQTMVLSLSNQGTVKLFR